jgi:hypothetical protein
MTEADWMACANPTDMIVCMRGKASRRKQMLYLIACCRRIWPLLADERSRRAIEFAEGYVEGKSNLREMKVVRKAAEQAARAAQKKFMQSVASQAAALAALCATGPVQDKAVQLEAADRLCAECAANALVLQAGSEAHRPAEIAVQCHWIRDIFANRFRPVTFDPAWVQWNAGTVRKMAQAIYDDRAFDRLPILADALEDAGCDNRDVLDHCRAGGEHVRGCWVVDLLLGNE